MAIESVPHSLVQTSESGICDDAKGEGFEFSKEVKAPCLFDSILSSSQLSVRSKGKFLEISRGDRVCFLRSRTVVIITWMRSHIRNVNGGFLSLVRCQRGVLRDPVIVYLASSLFFGTNIIPILWMLVTVICHGNTLGDVWLFFYESDAVANSGLNLISEQ